MSGPTFHCDDPACDRCYANALDYEIFASLHAAPDSAVIRFYNAVVVPVVNFTARWLSRACFLAAMVLLLGIAVGWSR